MEKIWAEKPGKNKIVVIFVVLVLLVIIFFSGSSCNLFLGLPRGRENLSDPIAQITAFTAVPSGDKSVVTMWNWKDAASWISSEDRIDEIKIMHSIAGYPDINLPFVGQKYDDNSSWQYEWDGLIGGITHYFALYAKDNEGTWYSPIRAKTKLPGSTETGINYSRTNSVNADNTGAEWLPDLSLEITSSKWAVLFFDFPDGIFVDTARIYLSDGGTTATNVTFAPLNGPLPYDDMEIWNSLDNGSIVDYSNSITFNTIDPSYDITNIVRAAAVNAEKAILITTNDPASTLAYDNNVPFPYIIADIIK